MYGYRPLGAFRLLLAALVMLQHYGTTIAPAGVVARLLPLEVGSVAVLIFFALSGFVIAEAVDMSYATKPVAFLANRMLRIMPCFVLCMALSIAVHFALFLMGLPLVGVLPTTPAPELILSARNILANFISVIPPLNDVIESDHDFLPVIWALRTELLFYFCVFFLLVLARPMGAAVPVLVRKDRYLGLLMVGFVVGIAAALGSIAGWLPPIFGYFPYFAIGYALYLRYARMAAAGLFLAAALGVALLHFTSLAPIHPVYGYARAPELQLVLLLVLLLMLAGLASIKLRASPTDRSLGDLTYPLYLVHRVPLTVLLAWPEIHGWAALIGGCAASLAAAAAVTMLLDPVVGRLRDRVRGRRLYYAEPGRASEPRGGAAQGLTKPAND